METGLITSTDFEKLLLPVREKALKLVDETTFIREAGFALQQINGSKQLLGADKQSVLQAVYNVALTGLSLNPVHKLAYLIPRYKQGRIMASLEPSYQGLVKLLTDTKSVKNVYAYPVFEGDEFEVTLGTSIEIKHAPKYSSKTLIKVYAVAILHDGGKQIEVMTAEEVNAIRDKSESYMAFKDGKIKSCIWEDNYSEMCRKTVIKRIAKYLPKTDQWEKFNEAVQIDNEDYIISDQFAGYLESLVETSSFSVEKQRDVIKEIYSGLTTSRAEKLKQELMLSQIDPVTQGGSYNQTDIKNHLAKLD